ncbi:hypothetical protein BC332_30299 [Capsicum chinense]|nr:hypothetical protein BC332_30299 [Capsicum chinense]
MVVQFNRFRCLFRKMDSGNASIQSSNSIGEDVRKRKRDNRRREFSPGTCESFTKRPFNDEISDDDDSSDEESDPDILSIDEEIAGNTTSSSESVPESSSDEDDDSDHVHVIEKEEAAVNAVGLRSPTCRVAEILEEFIESESEDSSDEDNDDPKDKDYRVSSDSRQHDESDDVSYPIKRKRNEEGKSKSKGGLVTQLAVEDEKHNKSRAYFLRPRSLSRSKKKKLNHESYSSPILISDDEESKSSSKEDCEVDDSVQNAVRKDRKTQNTVLEDSVFLKFAVDSTTHVDAHDKFTSPEEKEQAPEKETLPLIFRFEDEEPVSPEKEEWEKEMEGLFVEMDSLESQNNFTNPAVSPMQNGEMSACQMGNDHLVQDEQIGLICTVCSHVHLESKYIFPPFAERTLGRME